MHGIPRPRRRVAVVVRAVVLLLLVLALAGLQSVRVDKGLATIFVLDRSASMQGAPQEDAERYIGQSLQALGPSDQSGLVVFGKNPVIDTEPGALHTLGRVYASPDASSTDIASAIRLASATIPEGYSKRLVLLSDGNETTGDAAEAAQAAAASGIQIDVAPILQRRAARGEALVQSVEAPDTVANGEPFELRVIAQATQAASGILHVDRNGSPVASIPVNLTPGTNVIAVSQTAGAAGFYRYRATLDVDNDTDPRNNVGIGFVGVAGRPKVLLAVGNPAASAALATALKPHDFDIAVVGPGGLPTRADELQGYDSIILSDYSADDITDQQMNLMAAAVKNTGIGFGMIGGENSFLPGGYYGTPIADALPVDLNIKQRRNFPSTCIEIVVDASGSMSMDEDGVEKIKLAGSAAAAMVQMMPPTDIVGVAGSTDDISFVAPLQPATNKSAIEAECGRLDAGGGGIYITPSLQFAQKTLTPVNAKVRHLILEADGDDCDTQEGAIDLAHQMVAQGMTISCIAIGTGKDVNFLKALANAGKGYFYLANQAKELQRLVTQDSSIVARSAIEEGAFLPKVDPGDEVLRGLNLSSMPPLYAYDLTGDRPLARTSMRTAKDDPLLAYWQYGLGTSMAFTSDAQPKWARPWMNWGGFNAFWAQAIRETLRQSGANRLRMSVARSGAQGQLTLNAFDAQGDPINGLAATVSATAPDGTNQPVAIQQVGPGCYTGSFNADQTGGYIVAAAQQAPGALNTKPLITRAGFSVAYPPEYQSVGTNVGLLEQIAKITGGRMLTSPVDAFRPALHPGTAVRDLWPALLLAAVLLFVVDIAVRRIAIPFGEVADAALALVGRIIPLAANRRVMASAASGAQAVDRLNNVKRQSRASAAPRREGSPTLLAKPNSSGTVESSGADAPMSEPVKKERKTARESAAVSAAQRLLDAKRRNSGGGN